MIKMIPKKIYKSGNAIGVLSAVGLAIGAAIGSYFGNFQKSIAWGLALGILIGAMIEIFENLRSRNKSSENQ
jgi:F0F1-type ATP synthase assembly protein I